MANPDQSIDPRLLKSAKREFLSHGFANASLKTICENANVTTGALYKRYEGKEELFSAVVADTIESMKAYASERTSIPEQTLSDAELLSAWNMDEDVMMSWFETIYAHKEGFCLLLSCAAGTRYANYQHDWVEDMTAKTYAYYLEAKKRGLATAMIGEAEMHVLVSAYWTTIYEPFIHDFTWEQIQEHCRHVCNLFDWYTVLGCAKI